MVVKGLRNGFLISLVSLMFACSSTQQQQEELALEQGSQEELAEGENGSEEELASEDGESETVEGANYEDTANAGNNYSEEMADNTGESEEMNELMADDGENSLNASNLTADSESNMEEMTEDSMPADDSSSQEMVSSGEKSVMYITADMVEVYSQPDPSSGAVGTLSAGDPVLAVLEGSFAKIGEGKYVTIDSVSNEIVARTPTPNPWR